MHLSLLIRRRCQLLMKSELPFDVLGHIWNVADYDKDGQLDIEEFCVAMYLAHRCVNGDPVPTILPTKLVPPSKRMGRPAHVGAAASSRKSPAVAETAETAGATEEVAVDGDNPFAFHATT